MLGTRGAMLEDLPENLLLDKILSLQDSCNIFFHRRRSGLLYLSRSMYLPKTRAQSSAEAPRHLEGPPQTFRRLFASNRALHSHVRCVMKLFDACAQDFCSKEFKILQFVRPKMIPSQGVRGSQSGAIMLSAH